MVNVRGSWREPKCRSIWLGRSPRTSGGAGEKVVYGTACRYREVCWDPYCGMLVTTPLQGDGTLLLLAGDSLDAFSLRIQKAIHTLTQFPKDHLGLDFNENKTEVLLIMKRGQGRKEMGSTDLVIEYRRASKYGSTSDCCGVHARATAVGCKM